MDTRLKNKVAIVTGGGRGIGAALQAYLGHRNIQHSVATPNWLPTG
jgi:NAD(P)-dependent dehydrogenase (short-subunit alcohol dehydrogenase family)